MGRIIINLLVISMFFCKMNSCWSQNRVDNYEKHNFEIVSENINSDEYVVDYYLVEERVNCHFGSSVTRYKVKNLNLVSTSTMGVNNSRKVKAIYKKLKSEGNSEQKLMPINVVEQETEVVMLTNDVLVGGTVKQIEQPEIERPEYVYIDLVKTYEGVLEKGYFSVDMLKKVADSKFFKEELNKAAKWYTKLFEMTTDLEPIYYYRYAQSLKYVSQNEKANEMMLAYEQKSISTRIR